MNKFDKIIRLLLSISEAITAILVARYNSPISYISVIVALIVIDIILVDMTRDE